MSAYGSPYCDRVLAADPTSLTAFEQSLVDDVCAKVWEPAASYPIELVDPQRTP